MQHCRRLSRKAAESLSTVGGVHESDDESTTSRTLESMRESNDDRGREVKLTGLFNVQRPHSGGERAASAWLEFQNKRIRECTESHVMMVLGAVCACGLLINTLSIGEYSSNNVRALVVLVIGTIATELCRQIVKTLPAGSQTETYWCLVRQTMCLLTLHSVVLCNALGRPELFSHRTFLIGQCFLSCFGVEVFCVPSGWNMCVMRPLSVCAWFYFHWAVGSKALVTMFWGLALTSFEFFLAYLFEQRAWEVYQLVDREKHARLMSEALMESINGMLSSVFDASCECDEHGLVLAVSPHMEQVVGISKTDIIGNHLAALTFSKSEAKRVEAFLAQCGSQIPFGQAQPAMLIQTSLRRHFPQGGPGIPDTELHFRLCCVALLTDSAGMGDRRMLLGLQQLQTQDARDVSHCIGNSNVDTATTTMSSAYAAEVVPNLAQPSKIETRSQVAGDEGPNDCMTRQPTFTSLGCSILPVRDALDWDSRSLATLSYTWTHQAHGEVAAPATIISTDDAATQTQPALFEPCCYRGVSCQTVGLPPRLPRAKQACKHKQPRKINLRYGGVLLSKFDRTPDYTIDLLIQDVLAQINSFGHGCCPWHLSLATIFKATKQLAAGSCNQDFSPQNGWQCSFCGVLQEEPNDAEDHDQFECSLCGVPSTDILESKNPANKEGSSGLADNSGVPDSAGDSSLDF